MSREWKKLDKSSIFQKEPIYRGSECLWSKLLDTATFPVNRKPVAALKNVLLCSLYWAWITITRISPPSSMKKKEINGPVSCVQFINAMQWLRQLLRMYFFVLYTGHRSQSLSMCPWYHTAGKINENDLRLFEQWYRGCAIVACLHC